MEQATDHRCHLQTARAVPLALPVLRCLCSAASELGLRRAGEARALPRVSPGPARPSGAAGAFVLQPERGFSDVAPLSALGHFKASCN